MFTTREQAYKNKASSLGGKERAWIRSM
jgi:hypothetical protein